MKKMYEAVSEAGESWGVSPHCLGGQPVGGHLGHLHQEPGCRWGVVCWQLSSVCVCVSVCK